MNKNSDLKASLAKDLIQLLQTRYGTVDEATLYEVFAHVVETLRMSPDTLSAASDRAPQRPQNPPPSPAQDSLPNTRTTLHQDASLPVIVQEIFTEKGLKTIGEQVTSTGGIMLKLPEELPLNAQVDLCVVIPSQNEETWFEGRIVIHTPRGSAIDLRPVSRSYALQWQIALVGLQENPAPSPNRPYQRPKSPPPRAKIQPSTNAPSPPPEPPKLPTKPPRRVRKSKARTAALRRSGRLDAESPSTAPQTLDAASPPEESGYQSTAPFMKDALHQTQPPEAPPQASQEDRPSRAPKITPPPGDYTRPPHMTPPPQAPVHAQTPHIPPQIPAHGPPPQTPYLHAHGATPYPYPPHAHGAPPYPYPPHGAYPPPGYPPYPPPYYPPPHGAAPYGAPPAHPETNEVTFQRLNRLASENSPVISGSLAEGGLRPLLIEVAAHQSDGVLILRMGRESYAFAIQGGNPAELYTQPDKPAWSLHSLLQSADKISPHDTTRALAFAEEQKIDFSEALTRLKIMSYQQVLVSVQSRLIFALGRLMEEGSGFAEYYKLEKLPQPYSTPPVGLAALAIKSSMRRFHKAPLGELEEKLKGHHNSAIERVEPPPVPWGELGLSEKQNRFVAVILEDKPRVGAIQSVSNLTQSETLSFLIVMEELGFLKFARNTDPIKDHRHHVHAITERAGMLYGSSHYEILNLHWSAYRGLIDEAYSREAAKFRLESYPQEIHHLIEENLNDINTALKKAHSSLLHEDARRRYREKIVNKMQIANGINLYFRKGDMSLMRGDFRDAEVCFKRVLELNPAHRQARAKLQKLRQAEQKSE